MYQAPIQEDPDIREAVTVFRPTVLEIRARSARLVGLREGGESRTVEQAAIDDLVAIMQLRADRLNLALDDLFRLVNDHLRVSPPPRDCRPTGPHLRILEAEAIRAGSAERRAHEGVTAAQQRLEEATAARVAAQRACAGYVADWVNR